MRAFSVLSAALLFASTAFGLSVTSPVEGAFWDASQNTQTVGWNSVSTDPTNFTVVLVNMVSFRPILPLRGSRVLTSALFAHRR